MKNSNLEFVRALIREMNEELKGKQKNLDVAAPFGKLTGADFKKLRGTKKESHAGNEQWLEQFYSALEAELQNKPELQAKVKNALEIMGDSGIIDMYGMFQPYVAVTPFLGDLDDLTKQMYEGQEDKSLSPHDKITYDNSGKIIKKERLFLRGKVNIKGPNRDPEVRELNLSANQEVRPFKREDDDKHPAGWPGMTENQEVSEGLGNEIGNKVYFKPDSNFGKKFPSSEGYYAVIQDVTPASNYNMNALYKVVVHDKDDNEIGAIRADWTNFSTKPINENHEGQDHEVSMANNSLDSILWAVGELKKHLGDQERDIPAWIQDHITNAENFITQAAKNFHDYGAEEPTEEPANDMSLSSLMEAKKKAAIKLPKKKAAKKK